MRILFIGGTGFISTSVSRQVVEKGWCLYLLNRGQRPDKPLGYRNIIVGMDKPEEVRAALEVVPKIVHMSTSHVSALIWLMYFSPLIFCNRRYSILNRSI